MAKSRQLTVKLDDIDRDIVAERATAWGITTAEYARLQLTAPAADWRMRRIRTTADTMRAPAGSHGLTLKEIMGGDGFYQLPSGWWKHRNELLWYWVDEPGEGEDG